MGLFIHTSHHQARQAFSAEVNALLGLEKNELPLEGLPRQMIQGIWVWVEPFVPGKFRIRVRAECPACHKAMAAGRLQQHSKIHEPKTPAQLAREILN